MTMTMCIVYIVYKYKYYHEYRTHTKEHSTCTPCTQLKWNFVYPKLLYFRAWCLQALNYVCAHT